MEQTEIKKFIAEKLNQGIPLDDIQTALRDERGLNITFLELRLLAAEIENVDWSQFEPPEPVKDAKQPEAAGDDADGAGGSGTSVEVNKIARPGAAMSGSVRFASGASADWVLDQFGRLNLENRKGGNPTPEDIEEFQYELQRKLTGA